VGYSFLVRLAVIAKPLIRILLVAAAMTTLVSCSSEFEPEFPFSQPLNSTTVFMGDSITKYWAMPEHNVGIPGQTTPEMSERFSADVVGHGYKRVVILGGTNDILLRLDLANVPAYLESMATVAEAANIEVVLCKIPPLKNLNEKVSSVNEEIEELAQSKGYLLVDYYTPMLGRAGYFHSDGIHPTTLGYAVMESTLSQVVTK
jgi:lysophospholipase L1-like esterase